MMEFGEMSGIDLLYAEARKSVMDKIKKNGLIVIHNPIDRENHFYKYFWEYAEREKAERQRNR
jgi:hypothetical protein